MLALAVYFKSVRSTEAEGGVNGGHVCSWEQQMVILEGSIYYLQRCRGESSGINRAENKSFGWQNNKEIYSAAGNC